jgi:hypothetical protein
LFPHYSYIARADCVKFGDYIRSFQLLNTWAESYGRTVSVEISGLFKHPLSGGDLQVIEKVLIAPLTIKALRISAESAGHPWPDRVLNGVEPRGVADAPFPIKEGQAPGGEDPDHPRELDVHSLVRDFFGEQLRSRRTADWQEGDRRLFSPVTAAPGAAR